MQKTIYSDEYCRLLHWLRNKRQEKNLTMRQLADRLTVHHSRVGRIEAGERRLDVFEFIRYCEALGADPHEGLDFLICSRETGNLRRIAAEESAIYKTRTETSDP